MTLLTQAADASLDAASAGKAAQRSGLTAGEALLQFAPCYIKTTDGLVYMSNGTAADAAAALDGIAAKAYASGDSNVTLLGNGTKLRFATGLTPGSKYYIGATAGRWDTAATTGDAVGFAKSITATLVRIFRDA